MKYRDSVQKLSVQPGEKWYSHLPDSKYPKTTVETDDVFSLKAEASNLLDYESRLYHKLKDSHGSRDFQWVKKILQAGTLSDKISAHTLLLQDSTVYNLRSLEVLIDMVNTKGKRECLMSMDALQALFKEELLLEDRKLRPFNEQPLNHLSDLSNNVSSEKKKLLILWIFEDKLKLLYKKFTKNIVVVSHDTIEKTKVKAVSVLAKLLINNCEEEQFLLESITNKIGDPIPKVGSHACYQLSLILKEHTQMKLVVIQQVEVFIFRPNLSERAKYYSLCFLNQVILSHEEFKLANHLIQIYFCQFKLFVKKGEVNTKLMSALLTGVTRAYPYAKLEDDTITDQLTAMYRLVHMVSFNISLQALMLIFQVLDSRHSISDRFYSVLYRKLLDPALSTSSRQASFLNLVYRALKKDEAVRRIKAFVKRLLQVALYQEPTLQCGILIVISELNQLHPSLLEREHVFEESDDESDEHYDDIPDEDENVETTALKEEKPDVKPQAQPSWVHRKDRKKRKAKPTSAYDFDCRNPRFAETDSGLWELLFLRNSFHPSVSLFAHQVSNSTAIRYSGDPLLDFTISRFLDRFVYRNPKKVSEELHSDPRHRLFGKRKITKTASPQMPVTSHDYLNRGEEKIPVEELFMYRYLKNKSEVKARKDDGSDIESVCSEDFQDLLENMHAEGDGDGKDFMNFAKELGLHRQKGNKRKAVDETDDLSDGEDDFEDDDLDLDDEDLVDMEDDNSKLDEEDFVGLDDDAMMRKSKKGGKSKTLTGEMLADAEEFSALLEEDATNALDGTSEAFRTTKKTGAKQLKWEIERDRFVRGKNNRFRRKKFKRPRKA